jgi:tetratricopeptide (TPR) repeat protein
MGLMFYHMEAYSQSLSYYQDALRIRRETFGILDHEDVAETVNSIGLVLFKLSKMDLAKQAFQECIRLRTNLKGAESREVAVLWFNMATIYLQTGEVEEATEMYKESLRIEGLVLGRDHPDCAMTLQHLANVYEESGHLDLAVDYFDQALWIAKRGGEESRESQFHLYNLIGNLHFMQGRVKEMMESFTEACRLANGPGIDALSISGCNFYGLSKLHPLSAKAA